MIELQILSLYAGKFITPEQAMTALAYVWLEKVPGRDPGYTIEFKTETMPHELEISYARKGSPAGSAWSYFPGEEGKVITRLAWMIHNMEHKAFTDLASKMSQLISMVPERAAEHLLEFMAKQDAAR